LALRVARWRRRLDISAERALRASLAATPDILVTW
jgi:hypothetical protein